MDKLEEIAQNISCYELFINENQKIWNCLIDIFDDLVDITDDKNVDTADNEAAASGVDGDVLLGIYKKITPLTVKLALN